MFTVSKENNFLIVNNFDGLMKDFILDINKITLLSARTKEPYTDADQKILMEQINDARYSYTQDNPKFTTCLVNGYPFRFHEDDGVNLLFVLSFFYIDHYKEKLEDLSTATQWIFSNKKEHWNIGRVRQMVREAKKYGLPLDTAFFKLLLENEEYFQMEGYNYYYYYRKNNLNYRVEDLLSDYTLF